MVAFSDASFGNILRHGSHGGFVLLVAHRAVATGAGVASAWERSEQSSNELPAILTHPLSAFLQAVKIGQC